MKKKINKGSYGITLLILTILLIFSIAFFSAIGTADINPMDSFRVIGSKIPIIKNYVDIGHIKRSHGTIICP